MPGEERTEEPKRKSPVETKLPTMKEDIDAELGELEDVVSKKADIAQSSGQNGTLLAPSTSTPGAFAIDSPFRDESAQSSTADAQSSSAGGVTTASPTTAELVTNLTTAEPVTNLTTAEPVSIAMADHVGNESNVEEPSKSSLGDGNKRKKTILFVAPIAVIAILAIVFGVVFSRPSDPLESRRNDMVNFLSRITPIEAFESSGSKYNADRMNALQWIVEDDPMQLPIPTDDLPNSDPVAWALLQRYSMAVLYFATNGERWRNEFLFLSEYDVCRWNTIGVSDEFWTSSDRVIEVKGVSCDSDDRVNMMRFYWNNLSGTVPDELGIFSDTMTALLLAGNSISGTMPSLEKFSLLENLSFSDNCFTGAIPQSLFEIPSLEYFALYNNNNQITGSAETYCASTSTASSPAYREGTLGIFLDSEIECSCCTSCRPNEFECYNPIYNVTYPTINVKNADSRDSKGNVLQFQKECISPEELEWVAENCPCLVPLDDEDSETYTDTFFNGKCSDCAAPNALPSTGRD